MSPEPITEDMTQAGLMRRLAAMFYDAWLIVAIWFLSTTLWVVFLNEGNAVVGPAFQLFLYLEAAAFYVYFWRVKGQTLGMQVWKIRTVSDTGDIMSIGECLTRFFFATFSTVFLGLGFIWMLFDSEKLTWHDRASGTKVMFLGKDAYKKDKAEEKPNA